MHGRHTRDREPNNHVRPGEGHAEEG
jgi:hypothetical protein